MLEMKGIRLRVYCFVNNKFYMYLAYLCERSGTVQKVSTVQVAHV